MKLHDFQNTNEGEVLYHSHSSGPFVLHSMSLTSKTEKEIRVQGMLPFVDCPITVRKIKDCYVSNVNLIHTESVIFANNGYHAETPNIDISKFGIIPDAKLKADNSNLAYPVKSSEIKMGNGFYIGDTDNFGHWLFEFLPKALWYKRLFPLEDIPIIVGGMVKKKWIDLMCALSIDIKNVTRIKSGHTYKFDNLVVCSASIKRTKYGGALRSEDFMALRYFVERHFKHISYTNTIDCLFCTRKNARWRKIENEEEAINWLEKNFVTKIFEPETLSIEEQLNLLGKTKLFFGNGGSTPFTMFQPKDSVFFEIRPPYGSGIVGRSWPDLFRFGYHRIVTELADAKKSKTKDYMEENLLINMQKFKEDVTLAAKLSGLFPGKTFL